jgi:hypothetical protein
LQHWDEEVNTPRNILLQQQKNRAEATENTINMLLQRHRTNSCNNMKQLLQHEIENKLKQTATSQKAVLLQHQLKTYCNIKKTIATRRH